MSNEITKCRIKRSDNDVLKIVALKISADKMRVVTTAEVIHEILKSFDEQGSGSVENIINAIGCKF